MIAPDANLSRLQVRALAAGTREELGPVEFALDKGRLSLTLGMKGAGRYRVTW